MTRSSRIVDTAIAAHLHELLPWNWRKPDQDTAAAARSHPAAALAGWIRQHYRWLRTSNQRYLSYWHTPCETNFVMEATLTLTLSTRAASPPAVELSGVGKRYGSYQAVSPIDIVVAKSEFISLVGPSGCGKSTLLNMIAGFLPPTSGTLRIEEQSFEGPAPFVEYMFQKDTVLPWYSVRRNIEVGPRFRRLPRAEINRRTERLLVLGRLEKFADAYPHQFSGGMRGV